MDTDASQKKTARPPLRRFARIGSLCASICEGSGSPGEEPAYARFERLQKEKEEERARVEQENQRRMEENVAKKLEWEAEMQRMTERRDGMDGLAVSEDTLDYYDSLKAISQGGFDMSDWLEGVSESRPSSPRMLEQPSEKPDELDEPIPPSPFEIWLAGLFSGDDGAEPQSTSFGELAERRLVNLIDSFAEALLASANVAEQAITQVEAGERTMTEEEENIGDAFDKLLAKYEIENEASEHNSVKPSREEEIPGRQLSARSLLGEQSVDGLKARARRCRCVLNRLLPLAPCLAGDDTSARAVAALSALDLGGLTQPSHSWSNIISTRAISTADVCWALASEKRHLILERLLPSIDADGHWSWADLRRTGVAWWLHGPSCLKQLDTLIAKMAQGTVQQLRKIQTEVDRQAGFERQTSDDKKQHRQHIDETVFWFVAGRQQLEPHVVTSQLRNLCKTGVLKGEPAFEKLMNHERSSDQSWIRQNAFSLMQKHRYHLSVALLLMCGSLEDALRVVIRQLRDLQLAVLLSRRDPEVLVPQLLDSLKEPLPQRDPWLRFLLSWHSGDKEAASAACEESWVAAGASTDPYPADSEGKLFDHCMRQAHCFAALPGLGQTLLGSWDECHLARCWMSATQASVTVQ